MNNLSLTCLKNFIVRDTDDSLNGSSKGCIFLAVGKERLFINIGWLIFYC